MKRLAGTILLTALLAGCGADSSPSHERLLRSLPEYPGATQLFEYEHGDESGGRTIGRQYATKEPIGESVDNVTEFYRQWLEQRGWELVRPARAAYSIWQKDGAWVTLSRIGPEALEPLPQATVKHSADAPADARFFYLIEVTSSVSVSGAR